MRNGALQQLKPWEKVIFYFIVLLFSFLLLSVFISVLCPYILKVELSEKVLNDLSRMDSIRLNKILNFCQHLFLFILPPLFVAKMISFQPKETLFFTPPKKNYLVWVPLVFVFLTVVNELLFQLNHAIDFSLISKELQNKLNYAQAVQEKTIYAFVGATWKSYFVNLFLIALVPAIGEELTFRGVLQHLFCKASDSVWIGITLSAFIFALFHFQPYNFIPIFALGFAFGVITAYTGSIVITMILHFANNALSLTLLHFQKILGWQDYDTPLWLQLSIVVLSIGTFYLIYKKTLQNGDWYASKGIYLR